LEKRDGERKTLLFSLLEKNRKEIVRLDFRKGTRRDGSARGGTETKTFTSRCSVILVQQPYEGEVGVLSSSERGGLKYGFDSTKGRRTLERGMLMGSNNARGGAGV